MLIAQFSDYDAYAHAIERVNARFMMRKLEKQCWQVGDIALPRGVRIQHCWSGSGAIAQGCGPSDGVVLAIPAFGEFVANGEPVPDEGALLISPDQEFLVSIPGLHRWFNLFIPDALMQATGLQPDARLLRGPSTQVLRANSRSEKPVAELLIRFVTNAASGLDMASSRRALTNFELSLIRALRSAYGSPHSQRHQCVGRHPIACKDTILDAIELIEASENSSVAMADLADRINISERTLRSGFRKFLGMSPTQYMQLRLMHRARHRLVTGSADQLTVARIAADLGVWDFGRFAQRYRHVFGESPSATLHAPVAG